MRTKWLVGAGFWMMFFATMAAAEYGGMTRYLDLVIVLAEAAALLALSVWALARWFRRRDVAANGLHPRWLSDFLIDAPHPRTSRGSNASRV